MVKSNKFKIILGTVYLIIIIAFLWVFFTNFSINDLTSYEFIKNNKNQLIKIKNSNIVISGLLFLIFTIFWVLLLGFGSPIVLLAGFMFGKWLGSVIAVFGLTIGATLLYMFANFYLKDFVKEKFSRKFNNLNEKFKNNEFTFFLIYRFVGGIPFAISNIIPTLFNVKINNFFLGSIIGMFPQIFVWATLGDGIERIIDKNLQMPSFSELIFSKEIYLPLIGFFIIIILSILIKKFFYKD